MIGGIDVHLPSRSGSRTLLFAARSIKLIWSGVVFENGETGERYESFEAVPFETLRQLFVYRSVAEADAWTAKGASPELSNSMVHLIAGRHAITVVFDNHDALVESILDLNQAYSERFGGA